MGEKTKGVVIKFLGFIYIPSGSLIKQQYIGEPNPEYRLKK